jgi:cellulase/cellobiase CelA1
MKFAFISRHEPTEDQHNLASQQGIILHYVGDADAFTVNDDWVKQHGTFDGVVVVHPAAAMRLASQYIIGVFENANRAPIGEKPQFTAVSFHTYSIK